MTLRPRWLAVAILVWTLVAWGGRIRLLTSSDDWADIARIGGSVAVGFAVAIVLLADQRGRWWDAFVYGFLAWTVVVWARSLIINWTGSGSLPFKLVHTVLAVGFLVICYWAWALARQSRGALTSE